MLDTDEIFEALHISGWIIWAILLLIIIVAIFSAVMTFGLLMIYNKVILPLTNGALPVLTFWQMYGIAFLLMLIGKLFSGGKD